MVPRAPLKKQGRAADLNRLIFQTKPPELKLECVPELEKSPPTHLRSYPGCA